MAAKMILKIRRGFILIMESHYICRTTPSVSNWAEYLSEQGRYLKME